jgi:hypothetical protein
MGTGGPTQHFDSNHQGEPRLVGNSEFVPGTNSREIAFTSAASIISEAQDSTLSRRLMWVIIGLGLHAVAADSAPRKIRVGVEAEREVPRALDAGGVQYRVKNIGVVGNDLRLDMVFATLFIDSASQTAFGIVSSNRAGYSIGGRCSVCDRKLPGAHVATRSRQHRNSSPEIRGLM